jgi:cysteine-rich repeat protein
MRYAACALVLVLVGCGGGGGSADGALPDGAAPDAARPDGATVDAPPAVCGDGIPGTGEQCDDGVETAACDGDCTAVLCGDSHTNVLAGEQCDDGGMLGGCSDECTLPVGECGNGEPNLFEDCDDAGDSATCDADCTFVACGDGHINAVVGEACDDGSETVSCDIDCTPAACGDGYVNFGAGEDCDDTGESASCDVDCTPPACGDATLNMSFGEQCDDGNNDAGDGCGFSCQNEVIPCTVPNLVCGGAPMNGTTASGSATLVYDAWGCLPGEDKAGPEITYEFIAPFTGIVTFTLTASGHHDLVVVEQGTNCSVGNCVVAVAGGVAHLSAVNGARYLVIVDSDAGTFGPFTVGLACD